VNKSHGKEHMLYLKQQNTTITKNESLFSVAAKSESTSASSVDTVPVTVTVSGAVGGHGAGCRG